MVKFCISVCTFLSSITESEGNHLPCGFSEIGNLIINVLSNKTPNLHKAIFTLGALFSIGSLLIRQPY